MSHTTPEFDGKCAFAVSVADPAKAPEGKAQHAVVKDGKTYLFPSRVPKFLFQAVPGSAKRAQARWATR